MKNYFKTVLLSLCVLTIASCSKNDTPLLQDKRSFVTNNETDFFINRNGTVDIMVTGNYTDDDTFGDVNQRGFVYGNTSLPIIGNSNTETALGAFPVHTTFRELPFGKTFYIRGFLEMNDGTIFYGNEVQVSTNVDAIHSRSISMTIKPELFFRNSEGITPELNVSSIEKESPVEIGFEYSVNPNFSDSSITLDRDITGNIFLTCYSEFIEDLASNTIYYFRPYAKYADGKVTNGGTSTASFTQSN